MGFFAVFIALMVLLYAIRVNTRDFGVRFAIHIADAGRNSAREIRNLANLRHTQIRRESIQLIQKRC